MTGQGDLGQAAPLGSPPAGDDLGDLKVKRGAGPIFAVLGLLIAIGVGGVAVWYFALREDPGVVHEHFRTQVFGPVHAQYYDTFWSCALGGRPLSNFKNNTELIAYLQRPAKQGPAAAKATAEQLKSSGNCLPLLAKAIPEYQAIKNNPDTPEEYYPYIDDLTQKLTAIKAAWTSYADFHAGADDRHDFRERILKRGADWIRYIEKTGERQVRDLTQVQKTNAVAYYNFVQCALGDTDYTSFETEGETLEGSAQYKVAEHLELACDNGGVEYEERLYQCKTSLFSAEGNEITEEFEDAAAHWSKQGADTQSGAPLVQCLERGEEKRAKMVAENIAKAWYDFSISYNKMLDYSREQSGTHFKRGSTGE